MICTRARTKLYPLWIAKFKFIQLGNNHTWSVKIGFKIPLEVRHTLIECLQANTYLFAISPHEMPNIDPYMVCHQLNVHTSAYYVSQRRSRQFTEKAEAIVGTVKCILDAKVIIKDKYPELSFNVVIVKKTSGKWRICIMITLTSIDPTQRILNCS